jgi:hypothetical protein
MWEVSAIALLLVTFQNFAVLKTSWACIVCCIYYPFPVLGPFQPRNQWVQPPSLPSGWSSSGTMLTVHHLAPRFRCWKVNSPPRVYLYSVDRNNFTRPLSPFTVSGDGRTKPYRLLEVKIYCGDTYFFVILVSLYAKQLTISSCDYWFDVSNIAVGWLRVTTLYVICVLFCFSCVDLLLDNVNKIWNEVGPSEGTFISSKTPMGSCQVWCSFLSVVDADVNDENAISIFTVVLTTVTEVP